MNILLPMVELPRQRLVLTRLQASLQSPEADLAEVAGLLGSDPELSEAVLTAHRACAGRGRRAPRSVEESVDVLGLARLRPVIAAVALRGAVGRQPGHGLARYWDGSQNVARLCAALSRELGLADPAAAYAVGLMHDCGIPVLAERYPDYLDALRVINAREEGSCTALEERRYATHHAVVGFYLTRSWNLGPAVREVVLMHHAVAEVYDEPVGSLTRDLLGLLKLADHIEHSTRERGRDLDWEQAKDFVLTYLGLDEADVESLRTRLGPTLGD